MLEAEVLKLQEENSRLQGKLDKMLEDYRKIILISKRYDFVIHD